MPPLSPVLSLQSPVPKSFLSPVSQSPDGSDRHSDLGELRVEDLVSKMIRDPGYQLLETSGEVKRNSVDC